MQNHHTIKKLEQLAPELQKISERIKGCAGMIESLASCDRLYLGFRGNDVYAAKTISRRLYNYADCWRVVAEHITTPDLPLSETSTEDEPLSRLGRSDGQSLVVSDLFETYAEYLPPCLMALQAVGHNYGDAPAETEKARTGEAIFFVEEELRTLSNDATSLSQEVLSAWINLSTLEVAA